MEASLQEPTIESRRHSRKEVFQPHLPVRLPCYDLAPITSFTLGRSLRLRTSGTPGFHGLTGGVYKTGYCQLDDVVTNTLGAAIGYLVFALVRKCWRGKIEE